LFVGVNPDGSSAGLEITDQILQNLGALATDGNLMPPPSLVVSRLRLAGGDVAVVVVQPSVIAPVRYKGVVWVRRGPRRGPASAEDERVLSERRVANALPWDARRCEGATIDDLALDIFRLNYLRRAVDRAVLAENHRGDVAQLAALRLVHRRGDVMGPTNAGVLILGLDPLAFVMGAFVQFVSYQGEDKLEPTSERRITGDLLRVLEGLDALIEAVRGRRPLREGLREREVEDWPGQALHEVFVNAVIHRNYESTAPVTISQFTDRIEVWSPGGLFGMSPEDFPHAQGYRNPVLAEAARVYGFANRFGRGIDAAQVALARNGSPPATFDVRYNHVLAVIPRRP
jgi:ATP-dependent DNA helicase RecG